MKKLKRYTTFLLFTLVVAGFNSCGTISNAISDQKDLRPVFLNNCPSDAVVIFEGKEYPLSSGEYVKYQVVTNTTYKMPAVYLPFHKSGDLTIKAGGKKNTIHMKAGMWAAVCAGNCIFWAGLGHAVDYFTKNDRILKPRVIDVQAFLDGKPIGDWQKL